MLAHLEYVYFPSLLENLNRLHVLLLDRLDGHELASAFMLGQLN
jgi:hypothetical protein